MPNLAAATAPDPDVPDTDSIEPPDLTFPEPPDVKRISREVDPDIDALPIVPVPGDSALCPSRASPTEARLALLPLRLAPSVASALGRLLAGWLQEDSPRGARMVADVYRRRDRQAASNKTSPNRKVA